MRCRLILLRELQGGQCGSVVLHGCRLVCLLIAAAVVAVLFGQDLLRKVVVLELVGGRANLKLLGLCRSCLQV